MKILKVVVPKGEKPEHCGYCDLRMRWGCVALNERDIDSCIADSTISTDCPIVEEDEDRKCSNCGYREKCCRIERPCSYWEKINE